MFLQKTFQCSCSQIFFKLGRCYCKFPDNHKKYLFWGLFLIHVLIKLKDWWTATLLKKRPQNSCFPENILKCLKKTFCGTPPVAASENGFEKFLRISKGSLMRNDLYDLTNLKLNRKIVATFCIEMCMIQFLKDRMSSIFSDLYEVINQIRVIKIALYKLFWVKLP